MSVEALSPNDEKQQQTEEEKLKRAASSDILQETFGYRTQPKMSEKVPRKSSGSAHDTDASSVQACLWPEEARVLALTLLQGALDGQSAASRRAAGEGLARLAQAVAARSGCAPARGALHRYVGGIGSPQHLAACLGVIFALSQDATSPELQTWSLHSPSLLTFQSRGVYLAHTEPSVASVLRPLFSATPTHPEVHGSLGRCLCALLACLGPDLQGSDAAAPRSSCLPACGALRAAPDCLDEAGAISCLQQLHVFCPQHVQLDSLVPALCANLRSSQVCLRRAAVACLSQLAEREALEVCRLDRETQNPHRTPPDVKEAGLEAALFSLLDRERQPELRRDIRKTLGHVMAAAVDAGSLARCVELCKDVLAADVGVEDEEEADHPDDVDDSASAFRAPFAALRRSTRRFAVECLCGIVAQCQRGDPAHFDLALAQDRRRRHDTDWLVLHLGDLVGVAVMAATAPDQRLRMAGLQALLVLIASFKDAGEPDFPGHALLEQYQANVGAALGPAFAADAPPHVTAMAYQVCGAWISSGVLSELRDVRRVHRLLTSSLAKVQAGRPACGGQYEEATVTMETLALLEAWAQVYIVAVRRSRGEAGPEAAASSQSGGACLLALVQSDLPKLSRLWLAALQDYSALARDERQDERQGLTLEGGGGPRRSHLTPPPPHHTAETTVHYSSAWAPILHATALWLHSTGWVTCDDAPSSLPRPVTPTSTGHGGSPDAVKSPEELATERLHLILGLGVRFLCRPPHSEEQTENITSCLQALRALLDAPWTRAQIASDQPLSVELLSLLHRLMATRESPSVRTAALDVLGRIVTAARERVAEKRRSAQADGAWEKETLPEFGEGRDTGGLLPGRSLVLGALRICLGMLLRKMPALSRKLGGGGAQTTASLSSWSPDDCRLVSSALRVLSQLPSVCSPKGSVSILPTILYLLLGVLREMGGQAAAHHVTLEAPACPLTEALEGAGSDVGVAGVLRALLRALKTVLASSPSGPEKITAAWNGIMRSALATLLDMWNEEWGVAEQATLLTALTLFLLNPHVCAAALRTLALQRFDTAMDCDDPKVSCRCFQLLSLLFGAPPEVSVPHIRALAPALLKFLQKVERRRPRSLEELQAVLAGVAAFEVLVQTADQRPRLVAILFLLLISFLLDENAPSSAPAPSRSLHQAALKDIMRLGRQHWAVFRSLVLTSPRLKCRLEAALNGSQERASADANSAEPSITVKSNFL